MVSGRVPLSGEMLRPVDSSALYRAGMFELDSAGRRDVAPLGIHSSPFALRFVGLVLDTSLNQSHV